MMKIFLYCLSLIIFFTAQGQTGTQKTVSKNTNAKPVANEYAYNIHVTVTPLKNKWIYLGCYYGKSKTLVDSAFANNNSEATFRGAKKLSGGIYFVVSPDHVILFEIN